MAGLVALTAIGLFYLITSWRKWPDPLIDFGRELYTPWRLSHGALLYRDVDSHFGPLSQYLNSLLFAVCGPGLMVLVGANLLICAGLVTLLYVLVRRGWGALPAFAAAVVFISVFGFSQLVGVSNYNYAAPYAHETTHGLLVSLLLVLALVHWLEDARRRRAFAAGFLLGLTAVLKPEFMLAGAIVTAAALALATRQQGLVILRQLPLFSLGAFLPTLGFLCFFAIYVPWSQAWSFAGTAWLTYLPRPHFNAAPIQTGFAGLDRPSSHFLEHLVAALEGLLIFGFIGAVAWLTRKVKSRAALISLGIGIAALLFWISLQWINWLEVGRSLLGQLVVYVPIAAWLALRSRTSGDRAASIRLLLPLLALTLLTRMALNGRIYQYGFYQAALAGSLIPALALAEIPRWLRAARRKQHLVVSLIAAFLIPGIFRITQISQRLLAAKTTAIGKGRDRFYAFAPSIEPTGEIVAAVTRTIAAHPPRRLVVVPEGVMINYLTRVADPIAPYVFIDTNPAIVTALEANPPDRVVVISRDLREYGIARYGHATGGGREIRDWLEAHYRPTGRFGGNPLDYRQRGAVILERRD